MNTRNIAFYVFYAGFCLLALYCISVVEEIATPLFYFGCGITCSVAGMGIYVYFVDRKEGEKR